MSVLGVFDNDIHAELHYPIRFALLNPLRLANKYTKIKRSIERFDLSNISPPNLKSILICQGFV